MICWRHRQKTVAKHDISIRPYPVPLTCIDFIAKAALIAAMLIYFNICYHFTMAPTRTVC